MQCFWDIAINFLLKFTSINILNIKSLNILKFQFFNFNLIFT